MPMIGAETLKSKDHFFPDCLNLIPRKIAVHSTAQAQLLNPIQFSVILLSGLLLKFHWHSTYFALQPIEINFDHLQVKPDSHRAFLCMERGLKVFQHSFGHIVALSSVVFMFSTRCANQLTARGNRKCANFVRYLCQPFWDKCRGSACKR